MKQQDYTKEQLALLHSFDRLRSSDALLNVHMEDANLEDEEINNYLQREIGENTESDIQVENGIKAAAYLSVRRSKWKPRWVAKRMAELSAHALRDARLSYLYETERISASKYKEECEKNFVTNTVSVFKRIQKRQKRTAVKALLTAAIGATVGGPAAAIAGGIMLAAVLIPKPIKEKIKKKTKKIVREAGETIVRATQKLYESGKEVATKVSEKLVEVAINISENASRYSEPIIETIHETTNAVVGTVKEIGRKVKNKAKKIWTWLTN